MRRFDNRLYDVPYFARALMWICLTSVAMKATGGAAAVVFPVVALLAVSSGNMVRLFFVFLMMISAQVGNSFFFPKSFLFLLSIRATLFLIALLLVSKLAGRRHSRFVTPFLGILPYLLWECLSSVQGFAPIVSYLKLLLFVVIYFSYYAIANAVMSHARTDPRRIRSVILAFACLYVIGSVLIIPLPGISLMTIDDLGRGNEIIYLETLFKGMATHSQSLGPIIAVFSVLIFGDLLFSIRKFDRLYLAILLACPILIWKTSSRTALGTYLLGMMVVTWFLLRARGVGANWKGKIVSCVWLIVFVGALGILVVPSAREKLVKFALKSGKTAEKVTTDDLSFSKVTSSRQGAVDECLYNFRKKPVFGNGFQVSSTMVGEARKGFASYLSAPIEKGVWYAAVLEEGGFVGFVIFVAFLVVAFNVLAKRHAYISASCFFTLVLSNFGEFTIFSLTYTGGLLWAMVFAAVVLDSQRVARAQFEARMAALNGIGFKPC